MAERFLPRAQAQRIMDELLERIRQRCLQELVPLGIALWRHRGLGDEESQRRWDDLTLRIVAEETARARRELKALEVEGSA